MKCKNYINGVRIVGNIKRMVKSQCNSKSFKIVYKNGKKIHICNKCGEQYESEDND